MEGFVTIKKRRDILKSKQITNRLNQKYFNISYEKNTSCNVLFVITKKNFHTSVKRNLLKRRLREILKSYYQTHGTINYTLVFFCKKSIEDLTYQDIKTTVFNLLNTIVLKKK